MMRGVLTRSNYSCSKTLQVFTISLSTAVCCMHFECLTSTDGWLTFYQPIRNAVWFICWGTEFKNPRGIEYMHVFFFSSYCPQAAPTLFIRWTRTHGHIPLYKPQTKNTHKKPVERWAKFCFPENSLNYWLQKKPLPINYASVTKESQVIWMTFIRFKKIPNSYLYLVN